MHDTVVVVADTQSIDVVGVSLVELRESTSVDVLVKDIHVVVSVGPGVLVEETEGVADLVEDQPVVLDAAVQEGYPLPPANFTDKGLTATDKIEK